jgi:hypothetical protein
MCSYLYEMGILIDKTKGITAAGGLVIEVTRQEAIDAGKIINSIPPSGG